MKTVEDLAGCATDDLTGWTERKDGESKHEPGFLDGLGISREDAEAMIMQARLKAGWVTEAELAPPPAEGSGGRACTAPSLTEMDLTMLAIAQDTELDRGATSVAAGTERTCALTRAVKPVSNWSALSLGPPARLFPTSNANCLAEASGSRRPAPQSTEAAERNVFARGFKREVRVPPDLATQIESLLERAALDALAIAGKAGTVVSGFAKVEAALGRDDILALIHAADGADDGKRKLAGALRRNIAGKSREIAVIDTLTGAQLDLALSRPNVVHAALLAGPGSETFLARAARLTRFRTGFSPDAVSAHAPTDGAQGHSTE